MSEDQFGRVWKHTLDFQHERGLKPLSFRKKVLGEFLYYALKCDAEIGSVWCLNRNFHGSWVGASLLIKPENIEKFEEESGFGLRNPPIIKLN